MKNNPKRSLFASFLVGASLLAFTHTINAAAKSDRPLPDRAVVKSITGTAMYATGVGAEWTPLKVGMALPPGATIKTARASQVVLHLGKNESAIRINENSTFVIRQLTYQQTDKGLVTNTDLEVKQGSILGNVKKLSVASNYQVKTPNSVAGIRGTEFYVEASGTVHVLSGVVEVRVSVTLPNGTVVEKAVTVGAGQSLTFPASGVLNQALIENLAPTPTPASVQADLATAVTQTTAAAQVIVTETFVAASPGQSRNPETGFKVDNPQIEVISK